MKNTTNTKTTVSTLTGHTVARRVASMSATGRALLGADYYSDTFKIAKPTVKQAAQLAGVSVVYVHAAPRLSAADRLAVRLGQRPLIVKPQPEQQLPLPIPAVAPTAAPAPAPAPTPAPISLAAMWEAASDVARAEFVEEVGIDPLWEALEAVIDS